MAVSLVFTGWQQPILPFVASWLFQHYTASDGTVDLSRLVLVTPGTRSGRRLLELLVERVEAAGKSTGRTASRPPGEQASAPGRFLPRVLIPPELVTVGGLPERLYTPTLRLADPLEALLIRARMLQEEGTEALAQLAMRLPPDAPLREWMALARDLQRLEGELATELLSPADVSERCEQLQIPFDHARWQALGWLSERYEARLEAHGLTDRERARRQALREGPLASEKTLCLVSLPDLSGLASAFLQRARSEIVSFVFAPVELREGFDPVGVLRSSFWQSRKIALRPEQVQVVDRPRDQASSVLQVLERLNGQYTPDQITIGMADEGLTSLVERALELAGVAARPATGSPLNRSALSQLLDAMAGLLEQERPDRLASLLRHPDMEPLCYRALRQDASTSGLDGPPAGHEPGAGSLPARPGWDWLTLLDRFTGERLPQSLPDSLVEELRMLQPSGEGADEAMETAASPGQTLPDSWKPLVVLTKLVRELLPRPKVRASLAYWAEELRRVLRRVYGHRRLKRYDAQDSRLIHALEAVIGTLRAWERLTSDDGPGGNLLAAEAIRLLLEQLDGTMIPAVEEPLAVELLGWLELALDDAPVLAVVGVNEGRVPASTSADPFLPDRLRRELGLVDNAHRYARDALLLQQMLASRPHVTLIAGRRSAEGDPLVPSRLLFADEPRVVASRILTFYETEPDQARAPAKLWLMPGRPDDPRVPGYRVPPPEALAQPLSRLRVTAFRAWLACRYRFYLQHVLKLEGLNDQALELDGMHFGVLAHAVLQHFGQGPVKDSQDGDQIRRFLDDALDTTVRQTFGYTLRPAVEIQVHFLRQRLERFAGWQAEERRQGWQIQAVESRLSHTITVDGRPFILEGQVDRIDRHGNGQHRILDYKTPDKLKNPSETHLKKGLEGTLEWVDLQLPLYQWMAEGQGLTGPEASLGYVSLAADANPSNMLQTADWNSEQLVQARQRAVEVIRRLRAGDFWPPNDEISDEQYASLTFEHCVDRRSFRLEVMED